MLKSDSSIDEQDEYKLVIKREVLEVPFAFSAPIKPTPIKFVKSALPEVGIRLDGNGWDNPPVAAPTVRPPVPFVPSLFPLLTAKLLGLLPMVPAAPVGKLSKLAWAGKTDDGLFLDVVDVAVFCSADFFESVNGTSFSRL